MNQGRQSAGGQAADSLAQGVQAYQAALQVFTKSDQPAYWASTQLDFGEALAEQGARSRGAQAIDLFTQALQADKAALEVLSQKDGADLGWNACKHGESTGKSG